jgi:hypothetical protein
LSLKAHGYDVVKVLNHDSLFAGTWQKEYKPQQWLPLLQAAVMGAKMQDEEDATLSLQLLGTAAEAGEILRHIPPHPEPWPQVCVL